MPVLGGVVPSIWGEVSQDLGSNWERAEEIGGPNVNGASQLKRLSYCSKDRLASILPSDQGRCVLVFEAGYLQRLESLKEWSFQGCMGTDLDKERGDWGGCTFLAEAAAEALHCFTESHLRDKIFDPVLGSETRRLLLGSH